MTEEIKEQLTATAQRFILANTDECVTHNMLDQGRYGSLKFREDGKRKCVRTHRFVYSVYHNIDLVAGDVIMHTCDNPACANPKHLVLGTHATNCADKVAKGRQATGKGHGRYRTGRFTKEMLLIKVHPDDRSNRSISRERLPFVREAIKNRGDKTLKAVAEELGIKYYVIRDLNQGKLYK